MIKFLNWVNIASYSVLLVYSKMQWLISQHAFKLQHTDRSKLSVSRCKHSVSSYQYPFQQVELLLGLFQQSRVQETSPFSSNVLAIYMVTVGVYKATPLKVANSQFFFIAILFQHSNIPVLTSCPAP